MFERYVVLFVDDALTQNGVGVAVFKEENACMGQGNIDAVSMNGFFLNELAFDGVDV